MKFCWLEVDILFFIFDNNVSLIDLNVLFIYNSSLNHLNKRIAGKSRFLC